MGLFDRIKNIVGSKKEEVVEEPTSLRNLKIGGYIEFPLMFQPEFVANVLSEKSFQITSHFKIKLNNGNVMTFAELDNGKAYIRKDGSNLEVLSFIPHIQTIIDNSEVEELNGILELQQHEIYEENGKGYIKSDERHFHINTAFDMLVDGQYSVQEHLLDCYTVRDDQTTEVRYIRSKSVRESAFLYIFVDGNANIEMAQSCHIPLDNISFF